MSNLRIIDLNKSISDFPAYTVAWDGASTPDVSAIPENVTVTYDGVDYTGTLQASADTLSGIYLVSAGSNTYTRYATSVTNDTYSWVSLGLTSDGPSSYYRCINI